MSNVKAVNICGEMTFNATPFRPVGSTVGASDDKPNQTVRSWLADMNLPAFGLSIKWDKQSCMVQNCHGGKTAMYEYRIVGKEAVSLDALSALVRALQEVGHVHKAWATDIEEVSPAVNLLTVVV